MSEVSPRGLVRPNVTEADAVRIAHDCYGLTVTARELGSNQDRNFLLTEPGGERSVLRIDNPVFAEESRDAQHAALDCYLAAGVAAAHVIPGLDGAVTQRWGGFAVRRSHFAAGEPMVDLGYFAPVVLAEFGELAAASTRALADLSHTGLSRGHMWEMRVAHAETEQLAASIADEDLRERVLLAAADAEAALQAVAADLPTQAIHGDLTDDNVMGTRGEDGRVHPTTVLDLGDLAYGWRVSELAVTTASMLHHDADHPLRVLETVAAFHRAAPLSAHEARAVWPLVVLRAAILVASGWRQLEIDGDNLYARERIAGEQAIFDAATALPLDEFTEQVLQVAGVAAPAGFAAPRADGALRSLLPEFSGSLVTLDLGVEAESLAAGAWLDEDIEERLVSAALGEAEAVVLPYGVYRLSRAAINAADAADTWPIGTEIRFARGRAHAVTAPVSAEVLVTTDRGVLLELDEQWVCAIDGFSPSVAAGEQLTTGASLGQLSASDSARALSVVLCRTGAVTGADPAILAVAEPAEGTAPLVSPDRVPAWARLSADPAEMLGLTSLTQQDEAPAELSRREQIFASAQERYYDRPMQIERGWRHHLVDTTGRSYIDMVNNVTGLGHGHPGVADAVNRQIRLLNTNSRFLYRGLAEYSERLLALLPDDSELDTVLLVNSGSEAVDLALRLAQAATGRTTVVSLREAYHGWTMASDAVTTSAYDNPDALLSRPDWVHVADVPNRFRGSYRGDASDPTVGARYAADLGAELAQLAAEGRDAAAFICESVLGNAGGVMLPVGYLQDVYGRVRAAGGLCIADEVQVGFGRMGSSFWGFEQSGVLPDIITIAKPMGNGFPIGGVITSKRIADALATQGQFFSSAGGNPLSCQVGLAVLDAMEAEGLQQNAAEVGAQLLAGFAELAARHPLIGPIHGEGLYLGVELVRDRETLEPAKAEAAAICERLRELGVVVLTTSERSNVLKIKPPLCLSSESAARVLRAMDQVLTEGW